MLDTLISTADLAALRFAPRQGAANDLVLVDVRHDLSKPDTWGAAQYREGHLPGAIFAHIDRDLSGTMTGHNGRHPLPSPAVAAATFGRFGIDSTKQVVIYDQGAGMYASRLCFMLRWLGHDAAAVLDGGYAQWVREGRPVTTELVRLLEGATETLDVVNPYVTDRGMIRRIAQAAERGVRVRLFVPEKVNHGGCEAALRYHHARLLDAGVRIIEHPAMLHAKAFVRDGEEVLAGTCNLDAWSLKRFFEIDLQLWSRDVAAQFEERFSAPAEKVSRPGQPLVGGTRRLKATAFATLSPLL